MLLNNSFLPSSPEDHKGQQQLFDKSWASAFDYAKELYKQNAFAKDTLSISMEEAANRFVTGKSAMFISGSWMIDDFETKGLGKKVRVIPLPKLPAGKAHPTDIIAGFGAGWYVNKYSNKEKNNIPVKFVKYLTSPEVMAAFVEDFGVPAVKCSSSKFSPLKQSGIEMLYNAKSVNYTVDFGIDPTAFHYMWTNLPNVMTGKTTASKVIETAKHIHDNND